MYVREARNEMVQAYYTSKRTGPSFNVSQLGISIVISRIDKSLIKENTYTYIQRPCPPLISNVLMCRPVVSVVAVSLISVFALASYRVGKCITYDSSLNIQLSDLLD